MHVVIACGSRKWTDRRMIVDRLGDLELFHDFLVVVEGGAQGADRIAGQWAAAARARGVGWLRIPAQWSTHHPDWCPGSWCAARRSCVAAGPRRNQEMLDYALLAPEASVLAFKDDFDPVMKRGGTEDMVRRAKAAGLHGKVIRHAG